MAYCSECGEFNWDDVSFCVACDAVLLSVTNAPLSISQIDDVYQLQNRSRKLTFAGILCIASSVTIFFPIVLVIIAAIDELQHRTPGVSGDIMLVIFAILSIPGLFIIPLSFIGGICILRRSRWKLAVVATVFTALLLPYILQTTFLLINLKSNLSIYFPSILNPLGFAIGLLAVFFVARSEKEFH